MIGFQLITSAEILWCSGKAEIGLDEMGSVDVLDTKGVRRLIKANSPGWGFVGLEGVNPLAFLSRCISVKLLIEDN